MCRYWDAMIELLARLMELTAVSLKLPQDYFAKAYSEPECVLRLGYYPAKGEFKVFPSDKAYSRLAN